MKKLLAVGVIVLFLSVSVIPSTGNRVFFDDITPPVTTCTLNPPEPNGENGWYVSDVNVTLNATDDMSGVNATYYRLNEGEWETYVEPFTIESDGYYVIEYYSVDNAGNVEEVKSANFRMDKTSPDIELIWELSQQNLVVFTAICSDTTSGIDRVEFYRNYKLKFIDDAEPYEWWYSLLHNSSLVIGFIFNPQFYEENVTFFALMIWVNKKTTNYTKGFSFQAIAFDLAGNSEIDELFGSCGITPCTIYTFQQLTFPNEYFGYIGRFFIMANFITD